MALLSTAIGFGFPAYRSFKAVETPNKDDDTQWLSGCRMARVVLRRGLVSLTPPLPSRCISTVYWTVFGFFAVLEHCADAIIFWFPFYHT